MDLMLYIAKASAPVAESVAGAGGGRQTEIYFAHWRAPRPDGEMVEHLQELLPAAPAGETREAEVAARGFVVLPRIGTVSPWSSKATDIAQRCGLDGLLRVERGVWYDFDIADDSAAQVCDRMREQILRGDAVSDWRKLFARHDSIVSDSAIDIIGDPDALARENAARGLALTADDMAHLHALYRQLNRAPTVAELMLFAQANSEHCRHKIFNGAIRGAGDDAPTMMELIRRTHRANPSGVVTAFNDNAAVIHGIDGSSGGGGAAFAPDEASGVYRAAPAASGAYIVAKAETHNHPTAISPYPGAATGSGGEIRDEAAAGRGAAARAGFSGYIVSKINPDINPDAAAIAPPPHIAGARRIITEAPLGAAAYNNEFGRPALAGFFRSYSETRGGYNYGFHKPLMLAGGIGQMLPGGEGKRPLPPGALVAQLGGAGFRIGIGGGAASSRRGGAARELDFASVQRDNAEMQRRCQQVIETLRHRMNDNPILSLHDVGAGGLANAICELAHDAGRGARLNLDDAPLGEQGMSAAEILCNESQERYVLALLPDTLDDFAAVCARERCPFAVLGEITEARDIVVTHNNDVVTNLPLEKTIGAASRAEVCVELPAVNNDNDDIGESGGSGDAPAGVCLAPGMTLSAAGYAVLRAPDVACKRFLVTIGDRTVGGLTAREQMVGPWQTPVADCAAICDDFTGVAGAAFALGERPGVAALCPAAASRLAISEALLNLLAADVELSKIKLSLNWLANCADASRAGALYAAVRAASDFCAALGVGVIVGKDSLFMSMNCGSSDEADESDESDTPAQVVESPAFAAAFAFAPLADVRRISTPQLSGRADTVIMRLSVGDPCAAPAPAPALAASVAAGAGVFGALPQIAPDVNVDDLRNVAATLAELRRQNLILSYHDCSDGGVWATVCEMAFAANCGMDIHADTFAAPASLTDGGDGGKTGGDGWATKAAAALFCEAPALAIEVSEQDAPAVMSIAAACGLAANAAQTIARPRPDEKVIRVYGGGLLLKEPLADLRRAWEEVGASIARERDNPACAEAEAARDMDGDAGLFARLPKSLPTATPATTSTSGKRNKRPRVAILREVGTNGHREMAAAFTAAGFDATDITIQDLISGKHSLDEQYSGAAFCGGFSYGDVLGAGRGFALGILNNPALAEMFRRFFARPDAFALGACNGCQALAHLQQLMPDSGYWQFPNFLANESRRFEARLSMAEVVDSPSVFFRDMSGLMFPIVVSHAEGRAVFADNANNANNAARARAPVAMRYVDNSGAPAARYPYNPNGSAGGETGFCSPDGRITLLMPHPERIYRAAQMGWLPPQLRGEEHTPWKMLFDNARRFIG